MIEVVLKVPGVGVENPTCCSACLFSKLDLNFCLKLTTLSHPPQTDPFPCIFSLYISPPKAPHMLETCLDRLPQREIYPKPRPDQHHRTKPPSKLPHVSFPHGRLAGAKGLKAESQSGSLERLCKTGTFNLQTW